jgi:hypothetical protein
MFSGSSGGLEAHPAKQRQKARKTAIVFRIFKKHYLLL